MADFISKLRLLRQGMNYTQDYVATQLGMTQSGYCRIESGKTGVSLTLVEKIAILYQISPGYLLTEDIPALRAWLKRKKTEQVLSDDCI